MTEKKTYWLVDETGVKALVEGAGQRERWLPLGWADTTDPVGDEMVWVQHQDTRGRAKLAATVLPSWAALGWQPSTPPDPHSELAPAVALVAPVALTRPDPVTSSTPSGPAGDKAKESTRV